MNYKSLKESAELLGILGILISLVFLSLQLRQTQTVAVADLNMALVAVGVETAGLINENAVVWNKGVTNEELTPAESTIFRNLITALNVRWFVEYRHARELGEMAQAEAILYDWAAFLYQNPGARAVWEDHESGINKYRDILDPEGNQFSYWPDAVQENLEKLDQIEN